MSIYKVALALDKNDVAFVEAELDKVSQSVKRPSFVTDVDRGGNSYKCFYWDEIEWDAPEVGDLMSKIVSIKHSLITVDDERTVEMDIQQYDANNTEDIEIEDVLGVDTIISVAGCPLM